MPRLRTKTQVRIDYVKAIDKISALQGMNKKQFLELIKPYHNQPKVSVANILKIPIEFLEKSLKKNNVKTWPPARKRLIKKSLEEEDDDDFIIGSYSDDDGDFTIEIKSQKSKRQRKKIIIKESESDEQSSGSETEIEEPPNNIKINYPDMCHMPTLIRIDELLNNKCSKTNLVELPSTLSSATTFPIIRSVKRQTARKSVSNKTRLVTGQVARKSVFK